MDPALTPNTRLTFITGPVRSGKTRLALQMARSIPEPRAYIATAQGLDSEMAQRIYRHQEERGSTFQTIEEPLALSSRLKEIQDQYAIVVIDCLTLWVSNLAGAMGEKEQEIQKRLDDFLNVLAFVPVPVILIGNEVGWGIVPDNALARTFRDLSGRLHQAIAQLADQVILMVAGIPLVVKGKKL